MNTIYWHMNATQGGANLHPGVNLPPGANLHPGANCAHEHGLRQYEEIYTENLTIWGNKYGPDHTLPTTSIKRVSPFKERT